AFAFFFWGLYSLFLGYLFYYRKNNVVIVFSIFSSLMCIILNYVFIKKFQIMGAAYADLLTYFILFIAIVITVMRVLKLDLPWWERQKIYHSLPQYMRLLPHLLNTNIGIYAFWINYHTGSGRMSSLQLRKVQRNSTFHFYT